jgi:hypothetical protein
MASVLVGCDLPHYKNNIRIAHLLISILLLTMAAIAADAENRLPDANQGVVTVAALVAAGAGIWFIATLAMLVQASKRPPGQPA